jgi:hypothetical protein
LFHVRFLFHNSVARTRAPWDSSLATRGLSITNTNKYKATSVFQLKNQTPWPESESELYTSSAWRILTVVFSDFLGRSRYFFFQAAPQLYSRGKVDPVPDLLFLMISGSAGNRTRTSGSVARNFDHLTTEAVFFLLHNIYKFSSYLTGNNTSPFCSQELWPLDHRGGLLSST